MKRAPRFAVSSDSIAGALAHVSGAELHHMRDVARLGLGDEVALIDETGTEYHGRIERFEQSSALVAISGANPAAEQTARLILAVAIIKPPRMDFLVEKAAELGAAELWPLLSRRSVRGASGPQRLARWSRLARAAAKQSLTPRTMTIAAPIGIADLVASVPKETLAVLCAPDGDPLGGLIRQRPPRAIILTCGPEGGFDPEEIALMRSNGFIAAGLGPNRLRSETAALAALSVAAAAFDELYRGS